jgi:RecA/RadA recombinase
MHGVGLSFLRAGNFYALVDAEHTTPKEWLHQLMGEKIVKHPGFIAKRPRTYEETCDAVREIVDVTTAAKAKGELPKDVATLIVIDSIRKLVPDKLGKKLAAKGAQAVGVDGMAGRAAQIRAKMNSDWLDELVPSIYHANIAMTFISREYEAQTDFRDLGKQDAGTGIEYKVTGGKALIFESSLVCRVTRSWVYDGKDDDKQVVGERCQTRFTKTKVGSHEGKWTDGAFHISNGVLTPSGFDRARDVLEIALASGVVKQNKSYFYDWDGQAWHGMKSLVKAISSQPDYMAEMEKRSRG